MTNNVRKEYKNTCLNLRNVLEQHVRFCLVYDTDQIRKTNIIEVACCNCNKSMQLLYDDIAKVMFCKDCEDTIAKREHIDKYRQRLLGIQNKLLNY